MHSDVMPRQPRPPIAAVVGFIDCINRGDIAALGDLMTEDHQLLIPDEPPVVGRAANVVAWRGYADLCPEYVIHPRQITVRDGVVAVLGHTTGSHLGLPDDEEALETVIWSADVRDGALATWQVVADDPEVRRIHGFADDRPSATW